LNEILFFSIEIIARPKTGKIATLVRPKPKGPEQIRELG
jgi:hypothetical protein